MQNNLCCNVSGNFFDSFFSLERPRRKLWAPSQRSHVDETKLRSGLACYRWLCFTLQVKNTLTKESLGRNTCKASLCADRVMKMKPRFVWLAALLTEHHVNKWKVSIRCGIFQWTQKVRLCASRLKGSDLEFIRTWFSIPPPPSPPQGQGFSIHSLSGRCFCWTWLSGYHGEYELVS